MHLAIHRRSTTMVSPGSFSLHITDWWGFTFCVRFKTIMLKRHQVVWTYTKCTSSTWHSLTLYWLSLFLQLCDRPLAGRETDRARGACLKATMGCVVKMKMNWMLALARGALQILYTTALCVVSALQILYTAALRVVSALQILYTAVYYAPCAWIHTGWFWSGW